MGSKNRLSKELVPIIQSYVDQPWCKGYLEPFVGGANMIDKIRCERKFGSDIHKYLIALLKQAQLDTSIFPLHISEEEYYNVREKYKNNNVEDYDDWYIGLVGFCSAFGAQWFGTYARGYKADKITPRDMPNEAIRNLIRQAPNLKNIKFKCCDFQKINKIKNFVIYCDIPYRNTSKYAVSDFPYDDFYEWCKEMGKYNTVLISEYSMPDDFECIWSKETSVSLNNSSGNLHNETNKRVEKLFIYKGIIK